MDNNINNSGTIYQNVYNYKNYTQLIIFLLIVYLLIYVLIVLKKLN
jgi:hypothetical protein